MKLNNKRKWKYGSLSVVYTVAFVAFVIALNLVVSSVAKAVSLKVDLTQEDFVSVGEETKALLGAMGDDLDVTIYFLLARDKIDAAPENEDNYHNGLNLFALIRDLAEEYANVFEGKVRVVYKDIKNDPEFANRFLDETQTQLSETNVIVEGKYHHRVLAPRSFFSFDDESNDYFAFNGEFRLTAAILRSSMREAEVVAFTTGHGETPSPSMVGVLAEAGFEVQAVDLTKQELDARTRIVVVANPQADFIYNPADPAAANEIDRLDDYLKKNRNLIVMVNAATKPLPNLQSYLEDVWGMGYRPYHKLSDPEHSIASGQGDSFSLVCKYTKDPAIENDGSVAYNIHKAVSDMGGQIRTVLRNSVELFARGKNTTDRYQIETVLSSYETAVSAYTDESGQAQTKTGEFPLMMVSTVQNNVGSSAIHYQRVLLCASTDFGEDRYMQQESYGNRRVLLGAARVMGSEQTIPDIKYKPFGETALSIESGTARTLTVLICTLIPVAIVACGVVVFFRRRHL